MIKFPTPNRKIFTACPNCNALGSLAVATDAFIANPGPEGVLHVVGCIKCGWARPSTHRDGVRKELQLHSILKIQSDTMRKMMEENIRKFVFSFQTQKGGV